MLIAKLGAVSPEPDELPAELVQAIAATANTSTKGIKNRSFFLLPTAVRPAGRLSVKLPVNVSSTVNRRLNTGPSPVRIIRCGRADTGSCRYQTRQSGTLNTPGSVRWSVITNTLVREGRFAGGATQIRSEGRSPRMVSRRPALPMPEGFPGRPRTAPAPW